MEMIAEQSSRESNVGKKLTDYTTRKVIVIVLVMLFTNPIFMVETYVKEPNSHAYALNLLFKLHKQGSKIGQEVFDKTVEL